MAEEATLKWCISLPPVAQYAKGHMMIFAADTVDELEAVFDTVLAQGTMQKALDVAALLTGSQAVVETITAPPPPAPIPPANDVADNVIHTCAHGKRDRRTGTSARGPWVGYFCPLPKGSPGQCKAVFEDK